MRLTLRKNIVAGVGIGLILGASIGVAGIWAQTEKDVAPMTGHCTMAECHDTVSAEASISVFANQEALSPRVPVTVEAGRSLELDFYFENMMGKRRNVPVIGSVFPKEPHRSVGIELIMDPDWKITVGTSASPGGMSAAWQRGASGTVETIRTRWRPVDDLSGGYYLNFGNTSWQTFPDMPAVASDVGITGEGDLDGTAGSMGADCVIIVPPETLPGTYEITVAGIGHDSNGIQSHIARTVTVQVTNDDITILNPDFILYQSLCSSCHGKTPQEIGILLKSKPEQIARVIKWGKGDMDPIRGLEESEISGIIDYILNKASIEFAYYPYITHPAEEGQDCLSCHAPNRIAPVSSGHGSYLNDTCMYCHEVSAAMAGVITNRVPHPAEGRPCLECHDFDGVIPVSSSHEGRGEDICMSCHQVEDSISGVEIPGVPHIAQSGMLCASCHSFDDPIPIPQNHEDYDNYTCVACHESDPVIIASIPPIAHGIQGRGDCLACHSQAGWEPAPADHIDRPLETCLVCHN